MTKIRLNKKKYKVSLISCKNKINEIEWNKEICNKSKCKYWKLYIVFLLFIIIYLILIIWAKKIETIATFPAIWVNTQDIVGHIAIDLSFEDINISDSNWNNINWLYLWSWTWKTVYYFHGNWGPLSYFYNEIKYINSLWYNVMAYDYPGYWKSTGFPYKENIDEFSVKFYDYVKRYKKIKDEDLIVWWYSIWTAVATDFASKNTFDKLVLISPLSSRYDMAEKVFGFNLAKFLFLKDSYVTKDLIKNINRPVLIIHWNNDRIVPFKQWKLVSENVWVNNYANPVYIENWIKTIEKQFIEIDNFWHNYIINLYWNSLKWFFTKFLNSWDLNLKNNYFFLDKEAKIELELKNSKLEFINSLDLETDNSFTKFVNSSVSFNNKTYIPENLVSFKSTYIIDTKWYWTLREEAINALKKMNKVFYDKFNKNITVVSSYRSYAYQKWIKNRWCPDNLCAKAGYSEHQSGLAVDLWETTTNKQFLSKPILRTYFEWLNENANTFGFHNTYQKWLEIDGYEIEPWHWRYIWIGFATYLKENNITIAEFYNKR